MPASFFIATFGCKVNQYDSQVLRELLLAGGAIERRPAQKPDIIIVNTCTVTATADAKARRLVRRLARDVPDARIVVTGCTARRAPALVAGWHGVSNVVDPADFASVGALLRGETDMPPTPSPHLLAPPWPAPISDFARHARAFVKVQDGCDARCAYCVVPLVRGAPRSRPMNQVLDEVARLAGRFPEIVLTGIHLGLYRDPSGGADLAGLAARILEIPAVGRLRLSSVEPGEVTTRLLDLAASSNRFCPHFHLPLQSGSDRILGLMNRRYSAAEFLRQLDAVRSRLDRPAITTDVMVGFPGESDADFSETLRVCSAAAFSRIHVFRYSPRPGTAAAAISQRPDKDTACNRGNAVQSVARYLAERYAAQFVGHRVHVLIETLRDRSGKLAGYSERYIRVLVDGPGALKGRIVPLILDEPGPRFSYARRVTVRPTSPHARPGESGTRSQ